MEVHINTYGAALRVRGEVFTVTLPDLTGAGNVERTEYAPHQVNAFILYTQGCSVSSDAVELAGLHGVSIIFNNKLGQNIGRINYGLSASDIEVQLGQLHLVGKTQSIVFVRDWLCLKIKRKIQFLNRLERYRDSEKISLLKSTQEQLAKINAQIKALPISFTKECLYSLRGHEGNGNKLYFETLSKLLPLEYRFEGRSRRPAQDTFNAFLNFGYGVLYNQVENALVHYGIHPSIGFLHSMKRHQKAMLYDFIEPYRPWMDNLVFSLCSRKQVTSKHLKEHNNGFWLDKAGINLLLGSFYEAFNKDVLLLDGKPVSYKRLLYKEAEFFSQQMRKIWQNHLSANLESILISVSIHS